MTTTLEASVVNTPRITPQMAAEFFAQPLMTTMRWATYQFALRFLSPLMLDRMTKAQILGLVTSTKVEFPKDEPLETKARRKMYADRYVNDMPADDGLFGIPSENLYAALRDAGEAVQYGSGKHDRITLATKGTQLFSMIRLHEPFFPILGFDGKAAKWEVDLRKGNATQGNGAVGIIRGRFDEAGICGYVDLNVDSLSEAKLKELFTAAGIRQGLCSARPANKMPFGQFSLTHFKWIGGADPEKSITRATNANGETVNNLAGDDDNLASGNGHATEDKE